MSRLCQSARHCSSAAASERARPRPSAASLHSISSAMITGVRPTCSWRPSDLEVGVGEHDAAVARARRRGCRRPRARRAARCRGRCGPGGVPLVRIVDRERAGAVEVGELACAAGWRSRDRRRSASSGRLRASCRRRSCRASRSSRRRARGRPRVVGEDVEPRAARIDHQRVLLLGVELQHVARHASSAGRSRCARSRASASSRRPSTLLLRHGLHHVAEGLAAGARARAAGRRAPDGRGGSSDSRRSARRRGFSASSSLFASIACVHRRQAVLRRRGDARRPQKQSSAAAQARRASSLAAFSSWISQRPSACTSHPSVLRLLVLSLSDR